MEPTSANETVPMQSSADVQHNGASPVKLERTSSTSTSPTDAVRIDLPSLVAMKSLIENKISEETERAQHEEVERVAAVVSIRDGNESGDEATDDASPPISPESTSTTGSASDDSVLFNERPAPLDQTARNFPKRSRYSHRAAQSGLSAFVRTRTGGTNPVRALELLRVVLQPSFEKQIVHVCQSYIELLKMAAGNLQENWGEPVADIHVISAVRKSLEEAGSALDPGQPLQECEQNDQSVTTHRKMHTRKRKPVHKESNGKPHSAKHGRLGAVLFKDIEASGMTWNPDELCESTKFIMGVKANKAFGFGATRGRIYYRHPEIYKYAGDQDDKVWLYDNGHMPVTGGKAYLMIEKDVFKLAGSFPEYMNNPNVVMDDLVGFTLPPQIVTKIKQDMKQQRDAFL
ncbi:deoxynucleotidyltransferase terminal-interacting protein 1-like [Corticium candelabrum]|uniref:deoxynucleotidyltransferase terminal-interacting protein 1-like n=1 Tax=Corticium candelabrum TaxID=121492 RepID=UPI002E25F2A8|nr:deoxynucleotidyltransferase terminal-interacting protein 1-like [Corticium candelabrum]